MTVLRVIAFVLQQQLFQPRLQHDISILVQLQRTFQPCASLSGNPYV